MQTILLEKDTEEVEAEVEVNNTGEEEEIIDHHLDNIEIEKNIIENDNNLTIFTYFKQSSQFHFPNISKIVLYCYLIKNIDIFGYIINLLRK